MIKRQEKNQEIYYGNDKRRADEKYRNGKNRKREKTDINSKERQKMTGWIPLIKVEGK